MGFFRRIGGLALDFALPPRCPGCGLVVEADGRFCGDCWLKLEFLVDPACARCGEPWEVPQPAGSQCGRCLADPPAFDGVAAAVSYGEIARTLAIKLKHGRRPGVARIMAAAMAPLLKPEQTVVLVPVPLHRWRLWHRGFNQSALIARDIARRTGAGLLVDALVRTRATPMLRGMGPAARARTVTGAFRIAPARRPAIKGAHVVLVDDVLTTGATARACAQALKRGGATSVRVLCWARVARDGSVER